MIRILGRASPRVHVPVKVTHCRQFHGVQGYLASPGRRSERRRFPRVRSQQYSSAAQGDTIPVLVPQLGSRESVSKAKVLELRKVGARVEEDECVAVIETDKVAVDVPSDAAGVITRHVVSVGDIVSPGDALLDMRTGSE